MSLTPERRARREALVIEHMQSELFEVRLWAVYDFDADDRMTNERVYTKLPTADQIAGRVTPDGRRVS
jgi:Mn-dependent DtxR family transcriptional regulator